MRTAACRFCRQPLTHLVVDLGMSPLANSYLTADQLGEMERFYPLRVLVCDACWLVQLEEFATPGEIFGDYAYFSSYSRSWLEHARAYVDQAVERLGLGTGSQVIEIASNDGYLLQYVVARGIPALGIEPAANVARAAVDRGVPTRVAFFDVDMAARLVDEGLTADLVVGNNVFAHVPDLNRFAAGFKVVLKPRGVLTLEFPHLLRLLAESQFDTIYHEHFSYYSLRTAAAVLAAHGLEVFDVEELPTHGGSLRVWARHAEDDTRPRTARVDALIARERDAGLFDLATYAAFGEQVREVKRGLLEFLITARRDGKSIVGYGAAAKGNTLLNYCGIRTDFLDYTVDRSPAKQGKYLPGTHVPILAPERIHETRPDYVLILPWNLTTEITESMASIRDWGGRFVVPIPAVKVL
jgi:SAM-dependent methyltransferase